MTASSIGTSAGVTDSGVRRFLRRPLTVAESRLTATAAAIVAAVVVAACLRMWSSVWSAVLILLLSFMPILGVHISRRPVGSSSPMIVFWVLMAGVLVQDARVLLVGIVPLIAAMMLTWNEGRRGLRRAAELSLIRDFMWRSIGIVTVALAALAAADRTERAVFEATFDTPLEGLALSAGIGAGTLLFVALASAVWLLPGIAARRQSAGLILPHAATDTLWFGALLSAIAIGLDLRGMAMTGTFSDALGRTCLVALAASFAFAAARLGFPSAVETEVEPLWIVFLRKQAHDASIHRHVALLAAWWQTGPVTVVAQPEMARVWGGAHLRLAQVSGRVEALFPQRPIHFADWFDTLPPRDRWQALPVRELYLDVALWAELFETRLEPNAVIAVIDEWEPDEPMIDRLRAMLPTSRTDFHLPPTEVKRIARWPGVEVYPTIGMASAISSWIAGNRKERDRAAGLRFVVIEHEMEDSIFANCLANSLTGAVDSRGRAVRVNVILAPTGFSTRLLRRWRIGSWVQALEARRLLSTSRGRSSELFAAMLAKVLFFGVIDGEYDLLRIDGSTPKMSARSAVKAASLPYADRVISVLPPDRPSPASLSAAPYTGVLRRPVADLQVQNVARRYLALDFDPVAPAPAVRTRIFIPYAKQCERIAMALAERLRWKFGLAATPGNDINPVMLPMMIEAQAIVAVGDPDFTKPWSAHEIAQQANQPVFTVLAGPLDHQPGMEPMNADADGTLFPLRGDETDKYLERVLDITAWNIVLAVERSMETSPDSEP